MQWPPEYTSSKEELVDVNIFRVDGANILDASQSRLPAEDEPQIEDRTAVRYRRAYDSL